MKIAIVILTSLEFFGVMAFAGWLYAFTRNPWSFAVLALMFMVGFKIKTKDGEDE